MHVILAVLLLGELAVGIAVGVLLTSAWHQLAEARRQAYEEELAEVEQFYAAWAALRAGNFSPFSNPPPEG
jgi:hypothetical protein